MQKNRCPNIDHTLYKVAAMSSAEINDTLPIGESLLL